MNKILVIASLVALLSSAYTKSIPEINLSSKEQLFEGDILLENVTKFQKNNYKSLGILSTQNNWSNGILPFEIRDDYSQSEIDMIRDSMDLITNKTSGCITFTERTTEPNYVQIGKRDGCYSYVGNLKSGSQELSLGNGCLVPGIIVHEILHALGFYHEHTRADRDSYITVNFNNVIPGNEIQFQKLSEDGTSYYDTLYDINSIMHYGSFSFSRNNLPTIVSKDNITIEDSGERADFEEILTVLDVQGLNGLYQCSDSTTSTTTGPTTQTTTVVPTNFISVLIELIRSIFCSFFGC